MKDHIILVDLQDQMVGSLEKLRAHELGLLHRAFSIFVFRGKWQSRELLMHQRAADKYHSSLLWSNTCCSHPRVGEDLEEAAHRRLKEEMGFDLSLKYQGHFIYRAICEPNLIEHEYDHVWVGEYREEIITPNSAEVADYQWKRVIELERDLCSHPERYSPWLGRALSIALE